MISRILISKGSNGSILGTILGKVYLVLVTNYSHKIMGLSGIMINGI